MDAEQWALHLHETVANMRYAAFYSEVEMILRDHEGNLKYRVGRDAENCSVMDTRGHQVALLNGRVFDDLQAMIERRSFEIYDVISNTLLETLLLRLSQVKNVYLTEKNDGRITYKININEPDQESWILDSNDFSMKIKDIAGRLVSTIRNPDIVFQVFEVMSDRAIEMMSTKGTGIQYG